eukprot:TRINITY_DN2937_c0_g3_i2.p2 TRINITY_DN2937_c0_g3~~TRINITY_DN2937_c0_g3_i2.p2  ORF type:complete len:152 (+),score=31.17 TRINITY_DN2937_c0_g3_i2:571-1026(+)
MVFPPTHLRLVSATILDFVTDNTLHMGGSAGAGDVAAVALLACHVIDPRPASGAWQRLLAAWLRDAALATSPAVTAVFVRYMRFLLRYIGLLAASYLKALVKMLDQVALGADLQVAVHVLDCLKALYEHCWMSNHTAHTGWEDTQGRCSGQ